MNTEQRDKMIEDFVTEKTQNKEYQRKLRGYIKVFLNTTNLTTDYPTEQDYELFIKAEKDKGNKEKNIKEKISQIQFFFDFYRKKNEGSISENDKADEEQQAQSINQSTVEVKNEKHLGRPRKSTEARSKKLTIYLTPQLEEDVKDLARIKKLTTPDYIFRLIENEAIREAEKLKIFRDLEE